MRMIHEQYSLDAVMPRMLDLYESTVRNTPVTKAMASRPLAYQREHLPPDTAPPTQPQVVIPPDVARRIAPKRASL